ncbi:MAG: exodeoxyribonuclease V subunit gamma, partial [Fibrobacterota bacterium]
MSSLLFYAGNSLEKLFDEMLSVFSDNPLSPFENEIISVKSRGIEKWLKIRLAEKTGISAGTLYPFPENTMASLLRCVRTEMDDFKIRSAPNMIWDIYSELSLYKKKHPGSPPALYLNDDKGGIKQYSLAENLAGLFDRYLIYRPEFTNDWPPEKDNWQKEIYRAVTKHKKKFLTPAELAELLAETKAPPPGSPIPARITFFGISYLPPLIMSMLASASRFTEIRLFVFSVCSGYWADIIPEKYIGKSFFGGYSPDTNHYDSGNPLLASMGGPGKDFSHFLAKAEDLGTHKSCYTENDDTTLLGAIKNDILTASVPDKSEKPEFRDNSIEISCCAGPLRETEVLKDRILGMLDDDNTLHPSDIAVLIPDIDTYAPFINTVFGFYSDKAPYIPYSIADRKKSFSGITSAFTGILEAASQGKGNCEEIVEILRSEPFMRKFEITETELNTIENWVREAEIKYGLSIHDDDKAKTGGNFFNTWLSGIRRILAGYALDPVPGESFLETAPFRTDDSDGELIGKMCLALDEIFRLVGLFRSPATPE